MKREKLIPADFEALGIRSISLRIAIGRIAAQAFKTETSTKEKAGLELNLSGLCNGVYIVNLIHDKGSSHSKLIISR